MTTAQTAAWAALAFFPAAMVLAGLGDVATMKIRNRLVLALVVTYAVLAPLAGFALSDLALSVVLAGGVLAIGFTMFSLGWIGGGDVKLAAATVLWLGPGQIGPYLIYTALFGGVLTLVILAFRRVRLPARSPAWVRRLHCRKAGVPYGAAMAPAALIAFPQTPWISIL